MKKLVKQAEYYLECDSCKICMEYETIELVFSYPHILDSNVLHFCSNKCMREWITKELKDG